MNRYQSIAAAIIGGTLSVFGSSTASAALPDHPEAESRVMFTGDANNATLSPGEEIRYEDFEGDVYLKYLSDGNLVLRQEYQGLEGYYSTLWASGTSAYCAGVAELDPRDGLSIFDCNGNQVWQTVYGTEREDWHLEVYSRNGGLAEMRLLRMSRETYGEQVWLVQETENGVESRYTYGDGTPYELLTPASARGVWKSQGFDHAADFTNEDVERFIELFSEDASDPHTDAHRMLGHIDDHSDHTTPTEYIRHLHQNCYGGTVYTDFLCFTGAFGNQVDAASMMHQLYAAYSETLDLLNAGMADGSLDTELLGSELFREALGSAEAEELVDLFDRLSDGVDSWNADDRQRLLQATDDDQVGERFINNPMTRMLGRRKGLRADLAAEVKIPLDKLFDTLGGTTEVSVPVLSAMNELKVRVAWSLPRWDDEQGRGHYQIRFRFGLFDGVNIDPSDGSVVPTPVRNFLDGSDFKISAGVYGMHEWIWQRAFDEDGEINDDFDPNAEDPDFGRTYRRYVSSAGLFVEADKLESMFTQYLRPSGEDAYERDSIDDLAGAADDNGIELQDFSNSSDASSMESSAESTTSDDYHEFLQTMFDDLSEGWEDLYTDVIDDAASAESIPTADALETTAAGVDYRGESYPLSDAEAEAISNAGAVLDDFEQPIEASSVMSDAAAELTGVDQGVAEDVTSQMVSHQVVNWLTNKVNVSGKVGYGFNFSYDMSQMSASKKWALYALEFSGMSIGGATAGAMAYFGGIVEDVGLTAQLVEGGAIIGGIAGDRIFMDNVADDNDKYAHGWFYGIKGKAKWGIPGSVNLSGNSDVLGQLLSGDVAVNFELSGATQMAAPIDEISTRHLRVKGGYDHVWSDRPIPEYRFEDGPPVFLSRLQTRTGPDPAATRHRRLEAGNVEILVEEEGSFDTETDHIDESIGSVAMNPGTITDMYGAVIGEAGKIYVQTNAHSEWDTLPYRHTYHDPVVVLSMDTFNGGQPAHPRVQSAGANSASIQVEEWDYLDGYHAGETLSYVVMERGVHTLGDGRVVEADRLPGVASNADTLVDFEAAFDYDKSPVVIGQVQAHDSIASAVSRVHGVTAGGFRVRLDAQESESGTVSDEVGYIAFGEHTYPRRFASAEQRSTAWNAPASRAIDGDTNGNWGSGSVTHTDHTSDNWWEGELLDGGGTVTAVEIHNRSDCCSSRLQDFYILVTDADLGVDGQSVDLQTALDSANEWVYVDQTVPAEAPYTWETPAGTTGRYVMVYKEANSQLSLAEVVTYGWSDGPAAEGEWTFCASEWETCNLPAGTYAVRYGADGSYNQEDGITGSIACNNSTFGDPNPGMPKQCQYYETPSEETWTFCASENFTCVLPGGGTYDVRYGGNGQYNQQNGITDSIGCNNSTFGDPAPGTPKECDYR